MQPTHTIYFLRSIAGKHRHAETFALITRVITSEIHQIVPTNTHHSRISSHILAEKAFVEIVVSGRNRSMNRIKRRSANKLDGLIESKTGSHIVTDTLNIDQCSMSFITMINIFLDT